MQKIYDQGNYVINSSFGRQIVEGTNNTGGLGTSISFSIDQKIDLYESFFYQITPFNGQFRDFWDDRSNVIGGSPATSVAALSGFVRGTKDAFGEDGTFSVKLNPDNIKEQDEGFILKFYLSATDPGFGQRPVAEVVFLILDDDYLYDSNFYYQNNADVRATGLTAQAHYDQFGWKEGRDPNAFFSTTGYLAANPDVKAAGINPLTHYEQYGYKEGRDPSASFDNELYFEANFQIRKGVSPLAYFLQTGQTQGREAFAAIGKAADIGANQGFDAEYYLLSNSDVARAAITGSGDTFAFAKQHYRQHGVQEGRDPNAFFDTDGYLSTYTDVKSAGINPLDHYHQFGWKEGRDPSGNFDTGEYLSANKDVAAAGIDPLQHYLQHGALEGRSNFADGIIG